MMPNPPPPLASNDLLCALLFCHILDSHSAILAGRSMGNGYPTLTVRAGISNYEFTIAVPVQVYVAVTAHVEAEAAALFLLVPVERRKFVVDRHPFETPTRRTPTHCRVSCRHVFAIGSRNGI